MRRLPRREFWAEERLQARFEPLRRRMDALRILAYRAVNVMPAAEEPQPDDPGTARSLLQALLCSDATSDPDYPAGTLTVRLVPQATRGSDRALAPGLAELNQAHTVYPCTQLRLIYELLAVPRPDQPTA